MKFEDLCKVNVSEHLEKKGKFNYLSWTWAWEEFKKQLPDAKYEIKFFNGLPYVYDRDTGYMVFTEITANGETHTMWLPVMDNNHNAMKDEPYSYKNSYGKEITVNAATMFDINTAIMRCLVKNMAMFGLGLYVYAGEDIPKDPSEEQETPEQEQFKYQRPKCEECNHEIEPINTENGRMLVGDVVRFSRENYKGRVLCKECMKKASASK